MSSHSATASRSTMLGLILLVFALSSAEADNSTCDGFQATFDIKKVIGTWHAVAIIPEKLFPDKDITCYKVEFSETDGAGLRWLIKKKASKEASSTITNGTIVRQRYHTEQPFDVWSRSLNSVSGCFQQVLSLDVNITHKALSHNATMQLHMLESKSHEPFLLQMLWGRLISVVIYKKKLGVTQDNLKPVFELMSKLRGPQRLPKICNNPLKDILLS